MPKKNIIHEIAESQSTSEHSLMSDAIEAGRTLEGTAEFLSNLADKPVSTSSVQWWLARNGYALVRVARMVARPLTGDMSERDIEAATTYMLNKEKAYSE
jgi:hypothetical protein